MQSIQRISMLLVISCFSMFSKGATLSEQAMISLITCDPGEELYAIFGHSAIRVNDPINGIDKTYNYGTFEFDTPNFLLKFIRGKLLYKLGTGKQELFMRSYIYDERSVLEEVLALSTVEKERVYAFLEENYLPENRYYQYDFFFDNCATRIRDVFKQTLGEALIFKTPTGIEGETYRDLIHPFIKNSPWVDFGIGLALGLPTDNEAGANGRMFLPIHLSTAFQEAQLLDSLGNSRPFVQASQMLYQASPAKPSLNPLLNPKLLFWLSAFFVLLFTLVGKAHKAARFFDFLLFMVVGIAGFTLLFLMFGTEHQATVQNLNVFWANPFYLLLAPSLVIWSKSRLTKMLLLGILVLNLLVLASFWWLPQSFHAATLPIILLLSIRLLARLKG